MRLPLVYNLRPNTSDPESVGEIWENQATVILSQTPNLGQHLNN